MSARKKPKAVEETAEGTVLAVGTVLADSASADSASADSAPDHSALDHSALDHSVVEPVLDPELDQVAQDSVDEPAEVDAPDPSVPSRRWGKGKLAFGAVLALVVAAGAVWAAGALGGSGEAGLPESVSDPMVVISSLEDGGIVCNGAAVSGDVATCNATMAVRVFDSPGDAEDWISVLLKDSQTNSAIGWVRHGNVVVAAPLNAAPDVSAALGTGSQIY
ncbi:MAG: hypothetical protein LH645_11635 [Actinomycetia bacterium]|nr:hypothetical protein [Actinomycetes bacterium]